MSEVRGKNLAAVGRDEKAAGDGIRTASQGPDVSITKGNLDVAAIVEAEHLVVGSTVVGGDPGAAGRSIAAVRGEAVIADGNTQSASRRSGDTKAGIRLGPAPEGAKAFIAHSHGIGVRRHLRLDSAAVFGNGNGIAGAIADIGEP